ncbi:MAG: hypothetical protein CMJ89_07210 [Planctomycetes bacterium]|nr:hypothetical protein [Planctomycetota bacterium]
MKTTRLGSFSTGFEDALRGLQEELERCGAQIAGLPTETHCANLGTAFREHARELGRLFERLSTERSTVLLFGPPNSGKSTLINALTRRNLVEVSPLPGYPAPTFVEYGPHSETTCHRFNRSQLEGLGPQAAQVELRRAQAELARSVRELREAGKGLEKLRQAGTVRRVDVAVASSELKQGRVRFVECPSSAAPLFDNYADMLMGSHAGPSAAVFVVRAKDLFDERSFDGIHELLSLYKKVLVVVNLDRESRDLSDGGAVVAGLETSEPVRLIEVFENLCTQPKLLQAIKDECVRLFPIDLLNAAEQSIQSSSNSDAPDGELPFDALMESIPSDPLREPVPSDLLGELEQRLSVAVDESEELSTLVKSTLRRSREIFGEILQLLESSELSSALSEHERARRAREQNLEIEETLKRMIARSEREWELEPCFGQLRETLNARAQQSSDALRAELRPIFVSLLEDWFQSDESLEELVGGTLATRLADAGSEIYRTVALALRSEWHPVSSGFDEPTLTEFDRTGIDPSAHQDAAGDGLTAFEDSQPLRPLDLEAVKLRPRFFDHLLFRSGARLRRKVFGPATAPSKVVTSKEKSRRFDEEARVEIRSNVVERINIYLADLCRRLAADATGQQVSFFVNSIRDEAQIRLGALAAPREMLEQRIAAVEELHRMTEILAAVRSASVENLEPLAARHAHVDLEVLVPQATPIPMVLSAAADLAGNTSRAETQTQSPD